MTVKIYTKLWFLPLAAVIILATGMGAAVAEPSATFGSTVKLSPVPWRSSNGMPVVYAGDGALWVQASSCCGANLWRLSAKKPAASRLTGIPNTATFVPERMGFWASTLEPRRDALVRRIIHSDSPLARGLTSWPLPSRCQLEEPDSVGFRGQLWFHCRRSLYAFSLHPPTPSRLPLGADDHVVATHHGVWAYTVGLARTVLRCVAGPAMGRHLSLPNGVVETIVTEGDLGWALILNRRGTVLARVNFETGRTVVGPNHSRAVFESVAVLGRSVFALDRSHRLWRSDRNGRRWATAVADQGKLRRNYVTMTSGAGYLWISYSGATNGLLRGEIGK